MPVDWACVNQPHFVSLHSKFHQFLVEWNHNIPKIPSAIKLHHSLFVWISVKTDKRNNQIFTTFRYGQVINKATKFPIHITTTNNMRVCYIKKKAVCPSVCYDSEAAPPILLPQTLPPNTTRTAVVARTGGGYVWRSRLAEVVKCDCLRPSYLQFRLERPPCHEKRKSSYKNVRFR